MNLSGKTDIDMCMQSMGRQAKRAARVLAVSTGAQRDRALQQIVTLLRERQTEILAANARDVENARDQGLSEPLVDRLALNESRLHVMATGVQQILQLSDPIGAIEDLSYRPSGIQVGRMRVPLGVIGMIYEARPGVTIDAAALCLKSGNAVILRGGAESLQSNLILADCIRTSLVDAGLPEDAVQLVPTTDRAMVAKMARSPEYLDVLIPRGGKGLILAVTEGATVPVIKHLDGICHVYIDTDADLEQAEAIAINAKTQRYGTCNTMETLLVDRLVADKILPRLVPKFLELGVELRGCQRTRELATGVQEATDADWDAEYLAPILAIKVVDGLDDAMKHIALHGSGHTDAIVTQNLTHAQRFLREVDSSSVMVNASTRFADGFEYGLGAEIGISTNRLHVRGPVGLEGLTILKYVVIGHGHIRQ